MTQSVGSSAVTAGGYEYGFDATAEGPAGYISDDELTLWMQEKSTEQYDRVRSMMEMSTTRGKLMRDLAHVQAALDKVGDDPQAALDAVNAIQTAYADTEYAKELESTLAPIHDQLTVYVAMEQTLDAYFAGQPTEAGGPVGDELEAMFAAVTGDTVDLEDPMDMTRKKSALQTSIQSSWRVASGEVKAMLDSLGRDDQLALTEIQGAMADARETAQLASNIMSSEHQALQTIVGNIRA
jgi:hypothetical protein